MKGDLSPLVISAKLILKTRVHHECERVSYQFGASLDTVIDVISNLEGVRNALVGGKVAGGLFKTEHKTIQLQVSFQRVKLPPTGILKNT